MKVRVYLKSANDPKFVDTLYRFATGVMNVGDEVDITESPKVIGDEDCAVIFGSAKPRDNPWHVCKNTVISSGAPYIQLETPIIGRGQVMNVMPDDWYRIGVNGFLRDQGIFGDDSTLANNTTKPDRWENIKRELNVEMLPWRNSDNHNGSVVVALQLPGDASLRGKDISEWAWWVTGQLRRYTDRKIIIRFPQLPREYRMDVLQNALLYGNVEFQKGTFENRDDTLRNAWCTVTYTSGFGVDSVLNGCPTIAMSPGNFAYPISSCSLSEVEAPYESPDREDWIHNLSYCQWSLQEINEGDPWKHMRPIIEELDGKWT